MKQDAARQMSSELEIRPCRLSDAESITRLSEQLGYKISANEVLIRLQQLSGNEHHEVFVACLHDAVVGWIDACVVCHLHAGAFVEIGGLVVDECVRSRGTGKLLLMYVEAWTRAKGLTRIRVRSNIKRTEAHRFYERENYVRTKTSAVFDKQL